MNTIIQTQDMKSIFSRKKDPLFAIQKIVKGGQEKLIPMMRIPGLLSPWRPIVKVYDQYLVMDYEHPKGLSQDQCMQHIQGYQKQLQKEAEQQIMLREIKPV